MQVFVINLDRDAARLAHMRETLGDIPFLRTPAVDGAKFRDQPGGLTRFEIACLESHRSAWRAFLATPDTHACILEDDLHIRSGFAALVGDGGWVPADAHTVKILSLIHI